MLSLSNKVRGLAKTGMVLGLAGAAISVATPASAATLGNVVFNCYGVYYNTDWDQTCGSTGARQGGYYHSVANCTAPQPNDHTGGWNRGIGSRTSYDGQDCWYGIHTVQTMFS